MKDETGELAALLTLYVAVSRFYATTTRPPCKGRLLLVMTFAETLLGKFHASCVIGKSLI